MNITGVDILNKEESENLSLPQQSWYGRNPRYHCAYAWEGGK